MGRRTMEPRRRRRITQEGPPLGSAWPRLRGQRERTPPRDQATHVQAPGRLEMIDHPVIALPVRQLLDHLGQMPGAIRPGPRRAEMPHHLPRRDDTRGQQRPRAMPHVVLLALCRLAGLPPLRGILALQHLPARLFVGTDHQAALRREAQGMDREVTDRPRLRREGWVRTREPVHPPMGWQVRVVHSPPDCRAAHGQGRRGRKAGRRPSVEAPPGGWAVGVSRLTGGERHDVDPFPGGQSSAGALTAEHLGDQPARARETGCATGARSDDHSASQRRPGDAADGRGPQPAGSADNETPRLGGWHARARDSNWVRSSSLNLTGGAYGPGMGALLVWSQAQQPYVAL